MKRNMNKYEVKIITKKGQEILIDIDDFAKAKKHSWCISKTGYPVANINGKVTKLHRYLLGLNNPQIIVDHINRNPLDNRRCNLRICTQAENSRNTSISRNNRTGYLGISLTKYGRYRARIMINRKEIRLGNFLNIEDAIKARKTAEKLYFKEFAPIK